jgi:hypothetical protein
MGLACQRDGGASAFRINMRALRFPLQLAVEYRPIGQPHWQAAETANVSASGLLVQTPTPPDVDTEIEFRLALPTRPSASRHGEVSGRGHVVRQVAPPERLQGFAVAIDDYDFLPVNPVRPD